MAASANAYSAGVATGVTKAAEQSGGTSTTLPADCLYQSVGGANYFQCRAMWLKPASRGERRLLPRNSGPT